MPGCKRKQRRLIREAGIALVPQKNRPVAEQYQIEVVVVVEIDPYRRVAERYLSSQGELKSLKKDRAI